MSSSVRSRISVEDQIDEVVADEEQGRRSGDERQAHDRDGRTREHLGDLTAAGPSNEDHTQHGQEDRGDVAGEEGDDALGVDALGGRRGQDSLLDRCHGVRRELGGDHS